MGLNVVRSIAAMTVVALGVAVVGCQSPGATAPLRLSVMGDQTISTDRGGSKDGPYINAGWRDSDDASDNIFFAAVSQTGAAINGLFSPFVTLTQRGIQYLNSDRPSHANQMLEDHVSADNRREGMNRLADFGFMDSAAFRHKCRLYAVTDTDPSVRATAIRTCNRARDSEATPMFIKGLADSNDWVRLESAKALANVPDVNAADPLVQMLSSRNESRDIRIAAADALKHYRTMSAARALTSALDDKSFAIAWQARRSLRYLTDKDFGFDGAAWLAYFTGPQRPLG